MKIEIDGNDLTEQYEAGSLRVTNSTNTNTGGRFNLRNLIGDQVPAVGQEYKIYDEGDEVIAAGYIDDVREENPSPTNRDEMYWQIFTVTYNDLAQRRVITGAWSNMPAHTVVMEILERILSQEGVTAGNIVESDSIGDVVAECRNVQTVLQDVARSVGYHWNINVNKELDFFPREEMEPPFNIDDSTLEYIRQFSVRKETNRNKYRNRQWVLGEEGEGDMLRWKKYITEEMSHIDLPFEIEEPGRFWILRSDDYEEELYEPNGIINYAGYVWEKYQDEDSELGTEIPVAKEFQAVSYYQWRNNFYAHALPGNDNVTLSEGVPILREGDIVTFDYVPKNAPYVSVDNPEEQARRAEIEGTSGIYESVDKREFANPEVAKEYARAMLARHDELEPEIKFKTFERGWKPGQYVVIDLPEHEAVNDVYTVAEVETSDPRIVDDRLDREVSLIRRNWDAGWRKWIQDLVRRGNDDSDPGGRIHRVTVNVQRNYEEEGFGDDWFEDDDLFVEEEEDESAVTGPKGIWCFGKRRKIDDLEVDWTLSKGVAKFRAHCVFYKDGAKKILLAGNGGGTFRKFDISTEYNDIYEGEVEYSGSWGDSSPVRGGAQVVNGLLWILGDKGLSGIDLTTGVEEYFVPAGELDGDHFAISASGVGNRFGQLVTMEGHAYVGAVRRFRFHNSDGTLSHKIKMGNTWRHQPHDWISKNRIVWCDSVDSRIRIFDVDFDEKKLKKVVEVREPSQSDVSVEW